jgi:hypothetical protein
MTHHLTCNCGRVLHVRTCCAACPTCQIVYRITIISRPMTAPERAVAAAQLRGERLPEPEPTVTAMEGLR